MYLVALANGQKVRAGLEAAARHQMVRLIQGDRVRLRISPTDPGRGQITEKV
jgi:translation initiation factor IF-1